jgi:astacin
MNLSRLITLCLVTCVAFAQPRQRTRTAVLDGHPVAYTVNGGQAVTEGDIILGSVSEIEAASLQKGPMPRAAALFLSSSGTAPLWPEGIMYYTIAPGFPNQERIIDAINDWNTLTPLKLQLRVGQPNYVQFVVSPEGFCQSFIGMLGGQQTIELGSGCPKAAVVHEIGHAFGLMHEQSRKDRNAWLTVLYENVDNSNYLQFEQRNSSRDLGYYDYGSIMHYSNSGFSLDGNAALETVPPGIPIGQRTGLSAGDIDNISRTYGFVPTLTTVTTIPAGLSILVDGGRFTAPRSFNWVFGSSHTIAVDNLVETGSSTPPTRNRFVRWTDGGALSHTFTAGASQTVVAAEFQQSFRVQSSVVAGNGTVSVEPPSPDGYYLAGTKVKVTARPAAGHKFYRWQGTNPENFGYGLAAESMTFEVRGTLNFPGQFSDQFMTSIESTPPGQEILIDGVAYFTPARFLSFTPGVTHTLGVDLNQYDLTSSSRRVFAGWEDGSLSAARTIQIGNTPPVYSARFGTQHYLNYESNNGGSVTLSPGGAGDGYYDEGSRVTLTALPRGNSTLQYWLGDVANGGSTQDVLMDRSKYLLAWFGSALSFRAANAASYLSTTAFDVPGLAVAPLEIVTLLGTGLGPSTLTTGGLDQNGRLTTVVGNTRVLFTDPSGRPIAAPIIYASSSQTSVIVPSEVAGGVFTVISVERAGQVTSVGTASITNSFPGLFTVNASGSGPVASFNQDGSYNLPTSPAPTGSVVTLFATGAGVMDRSLPNGAVTDFNLLRPLLPVSVRIGTQTAEVLYAGSAPTLVHGVLQVNVRIPAGLTPGDYPIKLVVGSNVSPPGTTISVR